MTLLALPPAAPAPDAPPAPVVPWLVVGGLASVGAGAVHAAAVGAHGDHPAAALVFALLAAAQVLWGGAALVRSGRAVELSGIAIGLAAVLGWAVAKSVGLPFIAGLDVPEPVQQADASAALLAAVATLLAALALLRPGGGLQAPLWSSVAVVSVIALVGTLATAGHHHAEGEAGHDHAATAAAGTAHAAAHAAPVPYDPALPIDLSGTPGVTPRQQAAAENLVAVTLVRLPRWADAAVAEKAGFRSIGDGFTGTEHLINQAFLDDATTLDPDRPESLVYDTSAGGRRLVAAMYMLRPGTPLSAVPDIGGALVQWHTHENLCFNAGGFVAGLTDSAGRCAKGLVKPVSTPMVHVWITPNRCGPFAALEGIGGGQIAAGQVRLCDHAHGSTQG